MTEVDDLPDILISNTGSLQPRISGRYKHLPKTLLKKDCFYNTHSGFYVYPLNDSHYGIGRRLGGDSVVAKIIGEDVLVGRVLLWSEQDQEYVPDNSDEVDIWVDGDPDHEAGEIDYAPQALNIKSKYANIRGGYCIIAKTCCDRPVYYNEEREMYVIYAGGSQQFNNTDKNNKDILPLEYYPSSDGKEELVGTWIISPGDQVRQGYSFLAESKKTAATFPTECVWTEGVVVEEVIDDGPLDYSSQFSGGFIDSDFPPTRETVGKEEDVPEDVQFFRAPLLNCSGGPIKLYDVMEPSDILQGSLGDTWLLASIAAVSEFAGYIQENLIHEQDISPEGKYTVRLYDIAIRNWVDITIDDFIPCKEKAWYERRPTPIFSQPNGNEIYFLLLEKAFAKFAGSYGALAGGICSYAWTHLTGCESQEIWDLVLQEGKAKKSVVSREWRQANPRNFQEIFTESCDPELDQSYDDFYLYLRQCDQKNYIITCTIAPKPGSKRGGMSKRTDGLVEGHMYSILECRTIPGKDGNKYRLIKLRNPWGDCNEWNGNWSAEDPRWNTVEQAYLYRKHESDGIFWMSYSDFLACFTHVNVSPMNMKVSRGTHKRQNSICSDQFELILQNIRTNAP